MNGIITWLAWIMDDSVTTEPTVVAVFSCYGWNAFVPPKVHIEILAPDVVVLEGGALGR